MRNGYIIAGVIVIGLIVVYVVSTSGPERTTVAGSGLRNDTSMWGFFGHLLTDVEKLFPGGADKDISDADLNKYASSSGFADHG